MTRGSAGKIEPARSGGAAPEPAPSRLKLVLFACVPVLLLLVAAEVVVRVTGAADYCRSRRYDNSIWECDPILHFRTRRGMKPAGKPLNARGFRGPDVGPKRPGVLRVLALGDSCTFGFISQSHENDMFVLEPYPEVLQRLATADGHEIEVFNAGVCGYSTYHGIMLLRSRLRDIEPDLITVRYGWNDLLAGGAAAGSVREADGAIGRAIEGLLLRSDLYGFGLRLATAVRSRLADRAPKPKPKIPDAWTPTIPLAQFEANLHRIVDIGRGAGAEVWLVTAPHAFLMDEYAGHEDAVTAAARQQVRQIGLSGVRSLRELVEVQAGYNDAIRRVGTDAGVVVVDLVPVYRAHAAEHLFTAMDVIHPNQRGHAIEAEALYRQMLDRGVLRAPANAKSADPAR